MGLVAAADQWLAGVWGVPGGAWQRPGEPADGRLGSPVTVMRRRSGPRSWVVSMLGLSQRHGDTHPHCPPSSLLCGKGPECLLSSVSWPPPGCPRLPSPPTQGLAVRLALGHLVRAEHELCSYPSPWSLKSPNEEATQQRRAEWKRWRGEGMRRRMRLRKDSL